MMTPWNEQRSSKELAHACAAKLAKVHERLAVRMTAASVEILQAAVGNLSVAVQDKCAERPAERPQPNSSMEHHEVVLVAGRILDLKKIFDDVAVAEAR